jgi:hypothetical protein
MEEFRMEYEIFDQVVVGYDNEAYAWSQIGDLQSRSIFIKFEEEDPMQSRKFSYTLRSKSNNFKTDQQYSKELNAIYDKSLNEYDETGFLGFQLGLDRAFIRETERDASYQLEFEKLPKSPQKPKASRIDDFGLYMIVFSVFISISLIFTRLVEEKACGFREQLKNATKFSFLNNFALFSLNVCQMFVLFILCLLVTYFKGIWFSVNVFYAICLIGLYVTSIISFTFLVSAFFEQSKLIIH